jgi:hypothetical protein
MAGRTGLEMRVRVAITLVTIAVLLAGCTPSADRSMEGPTSAPSPSAVPSLPVVACVGGLSQATCDAAVPVALAAVVGSHRTAIQVWINSGALCPWQACLFDPNANFPAQQPPAGGEWVGNVEIAFAGTREHAGLSLASVGGHLEAALIGYRVPDLRWCSGTCPSAVSTEGRFRLELVLPHLDWRTSDPISGSGILSLLDGPPTTIYGSGHSLVAFSYDEVGGDRHSGYLSTADCVSYPLSVPDPINQPLAKSGGVSGDEPDAAKLRAFLEGGPEVQLPAGTWDITAIASFFEGEACSGPSHVMKVTLRITVGG